jgi:hypothetical protein
MISSIQAEIRPHRISISLNLTKKFVFMDLLLLLSMLPAISAALVGCDVSESELFPLGAKALADMTVYLW